MFVVLRCLCAVDHEVGDELLGVQQPEPKVRRQLRRAVDTRRVAVLVVAGQRIVGEPFPALMGGRLGGCRQVDVQTRARGQRIGRDRTRCHEQAVHRITFVEGREERRPPLVEGCENRVRRTVILRHRAGLDRIRTADSAQARARGFQCGGNGHVPASSVRREILGDVHGAGRHLACNGRDDIDGFPRTNHQRTTECFVQRLECAEQETEAGLARPLEKHGVEHEQRHAGSVGTGGRKCLVVVAAKIAAEPHDARHATDCG